MYRYITDPGHGWLEVEAEELERLNIANQISRYSYRRREKAYLEEDCDMALFAKAKKDAGEAMEYVEVYQENTPVRGYQSYRRDA